MVKLTRKQELQLIDLGIENLLNRLVPARKSKPKSKAHHKMSAALRKSISKRMTKYWAKRRQSKTE